MVNLRYHLVSITAVFLALGLGIVFGSTVVDRGTVSFLEDRLDEVGSDVQRTEEANRELRAEVSRLEQRETALAEESRGQLLPGLLEGVPVILVRLSGDDATDAELRTTLTDAGASVDAVVTLGDDLRLADEGQRQRFVEALQLRDALVAQPDRLRQVAAKRLAGALWWPAHPLPEGPDVDRAALAARDLAALAQAGFITIDRPQGAAPQLPLRAGPEVGMVMVSSPDKALAESSQLLFGMLADVQAADPRPFSLVVTPAEGDEGPVAELRDEDTAVPGVGTIDNVATFAGRLALVLALREGAPGSAPGHYGSGPGAQRLIPARTG